MKKKLLYNQKQAVSELVGGVILIAIAFVVFIIIFNFVFPLPIPAAEPNVYLVGYVRDDGYAVLQHVGGDPLSMYEIYIDNLFVYKNNGNEPWEFGELVIPPLATPLQQQDAVRVTVYTNLSDGTRFVVFDGIIEKTKKSNSYSSPYGPYEYDRLFTCKSSYLEYENINLHYRISNISSQNYIYVSNSTGNLNIHDFPRTVNDYSGKIIFNAINADWYNFTLVRDGEIKAFVNVTVNVNPENNYVMYSQPNPSYRDTVYRLYYRYYNVEGKRGLIAYSPIQHVTLEEIMDGSLGTLNVDYFYVNANTSSYETFMTYDNKTYFKMFTEENEGLFFEVATHTHEVYPEVPGNITVENIPMLISSLRTDSSDEDLICYNNGSFSFDATTYIFKWMRNGQSFAQFHMPFDTEHQTITQDYSDNGHHGEINSAQWTNEGIIGGAYYFRGASDYIKASVPDVFSDISSNDLTISLWIKSDDIGRQFQTALEASKVPANFVTMFQFGDQLHVGLCVNGIKNSVRTDTLASDTWYHIACVWEASQNSLVVYTNGIPSTEIGYRNYPMGVKQGFLQLGHGTASSRYWMGYIDEVYVFDRALSSSQIKQMYYSALDGRPLESVIVSEETSLTDIWQCIVIPSDSTGDHTLIESNTVEIIPYLGGE